MSTSVSISQRLSRAIVQMAIVWGAASAVLVGWAAHHEMDEGMDSTLQESAEILLGVLSYHQERLPWGSGQAMPAPPHVERLVWQLVSPSQEVLLRSHGAPDLALSASRSEGLTDAVDGSRVIGLPFPAHNAMLYVAQTAAERREAAIEAMGVTVGAALAIGLLCAALLGRRARHELLPLQELSRAVANFHPADGGAMLASPSRAELEPIRDAIVGLAERLTLRVDNERAFTAHAAHALRTPLAGLAAQLAAAMREAPAALQPRIRRAREASQQLQRVVTALLTLFRSGVDPKLKPVDIATLARNIPVDGLEVTVSGAPCMLTLDADLFSAALMNVFDNAQRHGARHLQIHFERSARSAVIEISDDGPGVSPDRLGLLQSALEAQQYDPPIGLGLMLSDLIARAHRGRLILLPTAKGFSLEFKLPQSLE